jgi:hypothetical protein
MLFNNDVSTADITEHEIRMTDKVKNLGTYHSLAQGTVLACS